MTIGEKIKHIRESRGISQRKFSEIIGVSHSEVCRIEKGERHNPSPKTLRRVAYLNNQSYFELMKLAGYLDEIPDSKEENDTLANKILELEKELLFYKEKYNKILAFFKEELF